MSWLNLELHVSICARFGEWLALNEVKVSTFVYQICLLEPKNRIYLGCWLAVWPQTCLKWFCSLGWFLCKQSVSFGWTLPPPPPPTLPLCVSLSSKDQAEMDPADMEDVEEVEEEETGEDENSKGRSLLKGYSAHSLSIVLSISIYFWFNIQTDVFLL